MTGLNDFFNALTGRGKANKKDPSGETPLYRAARAGSVKEVKRLLRAGADPNTRDADGLTPLHQAAYWGETEIVALLLKAGAKVDADNGLGWTPLHSAAISGGLRTRKAIIDMLLEAGAKPDVRDKHGWTPCDYMTLWDENAAAAEKLKAHMGAGGKAPEVYRRPSIGPKIH